MGKKKPVVEITEKPSTITVEWTGRDGYAHTFSSTDEAKAMEVYSKRYLEYIDLKIRDLQIRLDA
jgi:hypothetical protein